MNNERLEQLKKFYEEDPDDPFTIYAMATEYKKTDPKKSLKYFEKLLNEHENYVGTYYHVCKLYEEFGMEDKAQEYYIKGLRICQQENNFHAHSELQSAYNKFQGLDYEDDV